MDKIMLKKVRRLRDVFSAGLLELTALEKQMVEEVKAAKNERPPLTMREEIGRNIRAGIWRKPKAFKKTKS